MRTIEGYSLYSNYKHDLPSFVVFTDSTKSLSQMLGGSYYARESGHCGSGKLWELGVEGKLIIDGHNVKELDGASPVYVLTDYLKKSNIVLEDSESDLEFDFGSLLADGNGIRIRESVEPVFTVRKERIYLANNIPLREKSEHLNFDNNSAPLLYYLFSKKGSQEIINLRMFSSSVEDLAASLGGHLVDSADQSSNRILSKEITVPKEVFIEHYSSYYGTGYSHGFFGEINQSGKSDMVMKIVKIPFVNDKFSFGSEF